MADELTDIQGRVEATLRSTDAYQQMRSMLLEHARAASQASGLSERAALEQLLTQTTHVGRTPAPAEASAIGAIAEAFSAVDGSGQRRPGSTGLSLRVTLHGGRAFAGGLASVGGSSGGARYGLRASLLFRSQRACGALYAVNPGDANPRMTEAFQFELCPGASLPDTPAELLASRGGGGGSADSHHRVSIVLTREPLPPAPQVGGGEARSLGGELGAPRSLIATAEVDWRQVVNTGSGVSGNSGGGGDGGSGSAPFVVSLVPAGADPEMEGSEGLLVVSLDVGGPTSSVQRDAAHAHGLAQALGGAPRTTRLASSLTLTPPPQPPPTAAAAAVLASVAGQAAATEASARAEAQRAFFAVARGWWRDYTEATALTLSSSSPSLSPSSSGKGRPVTLFAVDEADGGRKLCCCFLSPLRAGRLLPSPRHALRFVSLLPAFNDAGDGAGNGAGGDLRSATGRGGALWPSLHLLAARRGGSGDAKALLLCSLLLGFGLDALVCLGTISSRRPSGEGGGAGGSEGNGEEAAWVVTFGDRGGSGGGGGTAAATRAVGWDPLSGHSESYVGRHFE